MNAAGRYRAFISYSHSDAPVAGWLHRSLEGYRVPKFLRGSMGEFGTVPDRLQPIFRDREELASAGALGERLQQALAESEALLVICSPDAACSHWVNEEILAFKRLGRSDRIYCLIVAGEPNAGDARECFPPALRFEIEPDGRLGQRSAEPIAADIRPGQDGKGLARLKLLAGLLGIDLDKLRKREAQRRHRRMLAIVAASMTGMTIALALAGMAWIARNDAQRRQMQAESLLGYMLGDLRQKLDDSSQVASMDSVSDKLLGYFASLDPRDLNDEVLTQQAQALTQIGQVRLRQARYPEALASFKNAYRRSKALADRHPGNGDRLFDRGQAEYWVGYVYWQSRDLEAAQTWLTRYRDTCRTVYAMDPKRVEWQHELAYGDSNLAVLELDRGQLQQASEGFLRSLGMLETILARTPDDPQLLMEVADQISWQGNVEEQSGHLQQALVLAATKSGMLQDLVASQPSDPNWQAQLSIAETMQSERLRILGDYARAEAVASDAVGRMRRLTAGDPANKDWAETHLHALTLRAVARMAGGKPASARDDLALAQPLMDAVAHVKSANRFVRRDIIDVLTLRAMLALQGGDHASTLAAANALQAQSQGQSPLDSPEAVGRHALAEVLIGMAATDAGRPADATAHFSAARRLLTPRVHGSRYWRVLDPWARLSLLAGDPAEGTRVQAQLTGFGYVPSMPWPGAGPESGLKSER
ncbi:TIR domain-containing protein [Rhodanobacter ginsengisoli]|uniref:TIR domain-containing protein n=1 Tax=Rhodanobacter ginsengisoli TaxID=418646 RepID=A0ABW0QR18_9GAMM